MAVELSGTVKDMNEPLEVEANTGASVEPPDEALLAELGVEFAQTQKPAETNKEAVSDAVEEVVEDPEATTEEDDEVEKTVKAQEEQEPKSKASKRIQGLVKEKKELEARLQKQSEEVSRQIGEIKAQQEAQYRAQFQAVAQQNKILQRQLEMLNRPAQAPAEDESKLTPMEQYERKILREAEARAEAKFQSRFKAIEDELLTAKQQKQASVERTKKERQLQDFRARSASATKETIFREVEASVFTPEDNEVANEMVLAYVAATGEDPKVAAERFNNWLDKYHQGRMKKVSATSGQRIQKSQGMPTPLQASKSTVQSEQKPSWDALKKHGFDNYVQWMNAGSPVLPKK